MRRFYTALCHRVRNKEEIKFAVHDFWLLNKSLIYVCTLGRIVNKSLTILFGLLKESLPDSLVHDD